MQAQTDMKITSDAGVRYFDSGLTHDVRFSVCSLVADQDNYDRLLASFRRLGFTAENTEFLAADNRKGNVFDGYTWMRRLFPECRGEYIVFCHDDVELIEDGFEDLVARLKDLTEVDPDWLLAGNAGGLYRKAPPFRRRDVVMSIFDRYGDRRRGELPARVETLDENFIVLRRSRFVAGSFDLGGFHMYGPDLCMIAEILGGSTYVIDFHLRHHGLGTRGTPFREGRQRFQDKYSRYFPGRTVLAPTGPIALGGGA
jgi:hypothetical protein